MSQYADWSQFRQALIQMHRSQRYAQAAAVLKAEGTNYPDEAHTVYFWRMCFSALSGDGADALATFERALNEGMFFGESMLRDDPDLILLRGNPAFEALLARNDKYRADVEAQQQPYRVDFAPAESGSTPPLLVALHGNTSNVRWHIPRWRAAAQLGWFVTLPQSSQAAGPDKFVWDNLARTEREISEHLAALRAGTALDPHRTVLGGFSMGAQIAPWLVLTGRVNARGFIALGPFIPKDVLDSWQPHLQTAAARGIRGFIVIGDHDAPCLPGALALQQAMLDHGAACELRRYPELEHEFPPDWDAVLPQALAFVAPA